MNGSEKQVERAEEIKNMFLNGKELSEYHGYKGLLSVLARKENYIAKKEAKGLKVPQNILGDIEKIKELIEKINSIGDASWFIDNSDNQRIIKLIG